MCSIIQWHRAICEDRGGGGGKGGLSAAPARVKKDLCVQELIKEAAICWSCGCLSGIGRLIPARAN